MEIGIGHMTAGAELVAIKVNRLEYPAFGSAGGLTDQSTVSGNMLQHCS
jgi:hypothetical protein